MFSWKCTGCDCEVAAAPGYIRGKQATNSLRERDRSGGIHYLHRGGLRLPLFVSLQVYVKTTEPVSMKFCGGVGYHPSKLLITSASAKSLIHREFYKINSDHTHNTSAKKIQIT